MENKTNAPSEKQSAEQKQVIRMKSNMEDFTFLINRSDGTLYRINLAPDDLELVVKFILRMFKNEEKGIPVSLINPSKAFVQGFAAACSAYIQGHGQDTAIEDTYRCISNTEEELKAAGVPEHDLEILKELTTKAAERRKTNQQNKN